MKNLVIVESPAKCKKIQSYLGKDYKVVASVGHFRDLSKKDMGIDIDNNYKPTYVITKNKVVRELRKYVSSVDRVIIATDQDREGEAIGYHLCKVLKLDIKTTARMVFNEITKKALTKAASNLTKLNIDLFYAQQARRVLDRLVGFSISPVLWSNIGSKLSAGRVQSIVLKLIVEKENEINNFETESYYLTSGEFSANENRAPANEKVLGRVLNQKTANEKVLGRVLDRAPANEKVLGRVLLKSQLNRELPANEICSFLSICQKSSFKLEKLDESTFNKNPPPPFTTSTLQQSGCSKFKTSPKIIMSVAQKLYESGLITYHRTDSTALSGYIIKNIEEFIKSKYGDKYHKFRQYKKKVKNSQEAHEAIRPTNINLEKLDRDDLGAKIYKLIWERTVACQMSSAIYYKQKYEIGISGCDDKFIGSRDLLKFDGYLRLYGQKIVDIDKNKLKVDIGAELDYDNIKSEEKYKQPPSRFSESTLVKKLEVLGIGRPSTYANIIGTVLTRKYAKIGNIKGEKKKVKNYILSKDKIKVKEVDFLYQSEKKKIIPTDIGKKVCLFMEEYFKMIMDYKFTSQVEDRLDEISNGKVGWTVVVDEYFSPIKETITELKSRKREVKNDEGIVIKSGKYGRYVSYRGRNISIPKGLSDEDITEEYLDEILEYPKEIGKYNKMKVLKCIGSNGKYVKCGDVVINIEKYGDIEDEKIIEMIKERGSNVIKQFSKSLKVMKGKYGPYILANKKIVKIPKSVDIEKLTKSDVMELVKIKKKKK